MEPWNQGPQSLRLSLLNFFYLSGQLNGAEHFLVTETSFQSENLGCSYSLFPVISGVSMPVYLVGWLRETVCVSVCLWLVEEGH